MGKRLTEQVNLFDLTRTREKVIAAQNLTKLPREKRRKTPLVSDQRFDDLSYIQEMLTKAREL